VYVAVFAHQIELAVGPAQVAPDHAQAMRFQIAGGQLFGGSPMSSARRHPRLWRTAATLRMTGHAPADDR
jgi:hypothetical protein